MSSSDDDAAAISAMKEQRKRRMGDRAQQQPDKRRKLNEPAPSLSSASRESARAEVDSDSESDADVINVEFELCDMQPVDFHTIRAMLLVHLIDDKAVKDAFPFSELADTISEQAAVGTTIKAEGTDEPLGFLTVLPMPCKGDTSHQVMQSLPKFMASLLGYVRGRVNDVNQPLDSILLEAARGHARLGLLISDRLVNCPAEITPPLFDSLLLDMDWARGECDSLTAEQKKSFDFTHYLVLCRAVKLDEPNQSSFGGPLTSMSKAKQRQAAKIHRRQVAADSTPTTGRVIDATLPTGWSFMRFDEECIAKVCGVNIYPTLL